MVVVYSDATVHPSSAEEMEPHSSALWVEDRLQLSGFFEISLLARIILLAYLDSNSQV
jgi:hypothetical protein